MYAGKPVGRIGAAMYAMALLWPCQLGGLQQGSLHHGLLCRSGWKVKTEGLEQR